MISLAENLLNFGTKVKEGEGKTIFSLFYMLFMLLLTAYLLKPVREELILVEGGSEIKSYATALQALFLVVLVPIYGHFSRKFSPRNFMIIITYFSCITFIGFIIAGINGFKIAIPFYIWIGAYGVLLISQFWAYASEFYNEADGKRLFGIIAFGASLGAFVGSIISTIIPSTLNTYILLSIATATLFISILPVYFAKDHHLHVIPIKTTDKKTWLNAFKLIKSSRYLLLIAIFVLLINWVNSIGEYLVSFAVEHYYDLALQSGTISVSKNAFIRNFYSEFYLAVNLLSMIFQFFIVSRCIKYLGVKISLLIIPVIIFTGYSMLLFIPGLVFFKILKVIENSLDYSLLNTVKQILYLPTSREEKYEARALIETVGVKLGDVLQGITIYIGLNVFSFLPPDFLIFIIIAGLVLIFLSLAIGKINQQLTTNN